MSSLTVLDSKAFELISKFDKSRSPTSRRSQDQICLEKERFFGTFAENSESLGFYQARTRNDK